MGTNHGAFSNLYNKKRVWTGKRARQKRAWLRVAVTPSIQKYSKTIYNILTARWRRSLRARQVFFAQTSAPLLKFAVTDKGREEKLKVHQPAFPVYSSTTQPASWPILSSRRNATPTKSVQGRWYAAGMVPPTPAGAAQQLSHVSTTTRQDKKKEQTQERRCALFRPSQCSRCSNNMQPFLRLLLRNHVVSQNLRKQNKRGKGGDANTQVGELSKAVTGIT